MVPASALSLHTAGLRFSATRHGDPDAPVVLCLHGFPDAPSTFRHQVGPLAEAGHCVITPTLRGYEPSSQPTDGDHTLLTMASDVIGWLDHLGVERAHLIGHDWGAAIVGLAAARFPDRVETAASLAIPALPNIPTAVRKVPRQLLLSWYMTFFQLPAVPERAIRAGDWRLVRRLWRTWSPGYELSADEWDELRTQFDQPGVVTSALAYYRQNATPPILLGLRSTPATERAAVEPPMLFLYGSDDGCMDRRMFEHTIDEDDFPGGVRRVELSGAGHFLHLERPDAVKDALLDHLRR
ncbi:MAG: alpha/beta fold hydrolase [Actinomycetota bacterium]